MRWAVLSTPIDGLAVAVDDYGVRAVRFGASSPARGDRPSAQDPVPAADPLMDALDQLRAYFAGELTDFSVPLSVRDGSGFERAVWAALRDIPYGYTRTYGEIAKAVGEPGAARAVGLACNRNRLPILLPCHRVVGAGGKLVGFGGGLHRKRFLLELEARGRIQREFGG